MTDCKNCEPEDEYCASGDCPNDTLTEQYKSINESLNKYVKANVELATWMLEKQNAELKERNESLNNRDINLCRIANDIRDENFALKELLKECKDLIELMQAISGIKQIKFTVIDDFVKKINEVLDA